MLLWLLLLAVITTATHCVGADEVRAGGNRRLNAGRSSSAVVSDASGIAVVETTGGKFTSHAVHSSHRTTTRRLKQAVGRPQTPAGGQPGQPAPVLPPAPGVAVPLTEPIPPATGAPGRPGPTPTTPVPPGYTFGPTQTGVVPGAGAYSPPPLPVYPASVTKVDVDSNVVEIGTGNAAAIVDTFEPVESIVATYAPNPEQGYTDLSVLLRMKNDTDGKKDKKDKTPVMEEGESLKATIIPLLPILGGAVTDVPAPEPEVRVDFYIPFPAAGAVGTPAAEAAAEATPSPQLQATLTNAVTIRG